MHEGENEKNQNHASHSTNGERNDSENIIVDVFRWSRCKTPLPQKVMRSVGIPLPLEYVEVLHIALNLILSSCTVLFQKKKYIRNFSILKFDRIMGCCLEKSFKTCQN